jgi:DNA helicase-2/ATP-dependent DNA helicase PcrA
MNVEPASSLLSGLNDVQRTAATHLNGPLVVFAGAGSGKTRIITHRIAWLIEQGVKPWEILAVTFTNKAAQEMKHRIQDLTPMASRALIATFHSACARWLREFATELGFTSDFTIYDDADTVAALKTVLAELNVKLDEQTSVQEYKGAIAKIKTMAMLPGDERLAREYSGLMPPSGVEVYKRYQEYLAACNAMDFADLIMNMLLLLRRNAMVRNILQTRYKYILVDEYQDTNRTQFELIARLAEAHRNLFVVGDDDQSIYSWRGAVPSNIIDFDKVYPDAVKVTLEQNYRCSGNIVTAANAMINNNIHRVPKTLFTQNATGDKITYRLEPDNDIEAWWIVDAIKRDLGEFALRDTAIFYRTNSQSRLLEDALRRENIPYQIYGTVRFYDRVEIKDLMAYFRVVVNPNDDVSLKRILNTPGRGIGDKAEATVEAEAARRGVPMITAIEQMVAEGYPKLGAKLKVFLDIVGKLRVSLPKAPLDEVLELVLSAVGYIDHVRKKYPEQAEDKIENIHELGAALADFGGAFPEATVAEWLQSVTLSSSEGENNGGVSLMTLHMAKGLEFDRVFIVGVEENLLPHRNALEDPEMIEEERRLFYVGMTRAKVKLSLTGAYRRRTFQSWTANKPSRFINELPHATFQPATDVESGFLTKTARDEDGGLRYEYDGDEGPAEVHVGATVRHPTYGLGKVEQLLDEFGMLKVVVRFDEFGVRKVASHHLSA